MDPDVTLQLSLDQYKPEVTHRVTLAENQCGRWISQLNNKTTTCVSPHAGGPCPHPTAVTFEVCGIRTHLHWVWLHNWGFRPFPANTKVLSTQVFTPWAGRRPLAALSWHSSTCKGCSFSKKSARMQLWGLCWVFFPGVTHCAAHGYKGKRKQDQPPNRWNRPPGPKAVKSELLNSS